MPTYCYTTDDGETVERYFPVERRRPTSIRLADGRLARRDIAAEHANAGAHPRAQWPMLSDAMGIHPADTAEVMEFARKRGCPTEFTRDGRAILTSPSHRKAWAEANGLYDRNGGYSDPQRK